MVGGERRRRLYHFQLPTALSVVFIAAFGQCGSEICQAPPEAIDAVGDGV